MVGCLNRTLVPSNNLQSISSDWGGTGKIFVLVTQNIGGGGHIYGLATEIPTILLTQIAITSQMLSLRPSIYVQLTILLRLGKYGPS